MLDISPTLTEAAGAIVDVSLLFGVLSLSVCFSRKINFKFVENYQCFSYECLLSYCGIRCIINTHKKYSVYVLLSFVTLIMINSYS